VLCRSGRYQQKLPIPNLVIEGSSLHWYSPQLKVLVLSEAESGIELNLNSAEVPWGELAVAETAPETLLNRASDG